MSGESVKVMVRCRPMNQLEQTKNAKQCIQIDQQSFTITLTNTKENNSTKQFTFDYVFPSATSQQTIYEQTAFQLVENVVEGYNGTMFAYGQTGCGKTYTMLGDPRNESQKGIIPRTFSHILSIVGSGDAKCTQYLISCSYIEIYNEEIHDLLARNSKQKLDLKENKDKAVYIKDLTKQVVKSIDEMEKYMNLGNNFRSVGETQMNKESSRSHCIFTLYIEQSNMDEKGNQRFRAGKLNLVDLAGSERQAKTLATGDRLKEATKINLSLSALGNVISALVDGKSTHIPYRDSKLTRLLQDSLGGNTKTIMIAAISPVDYNYDETLSTLRYASRAKQIKNKPVINEDPKDALLRQYAEEIAKLKQLLDKQQKGETITGKDLPQHSLAGSKIMVEQNIVIQKDPEVEQKYNKLQDEMMQKLQEDQQVFEKQKLERDQLEHALKDLQQKVVTGGQADDDQKKKYKSISSKLKKQQKEHEKLAEEKKEKEQQLFSLEKQYSSLQEEIKETRTGFALIKEKNEQLQNEIKDINREFQIQKEDLLDTLRISQKNEQLYLGICKILLSDKEIEIIRGSSEWDNDNKEFTIPPFTFKERELKFPKFVNQLHADAMINQIKESRDLQLNGPNNQSINDNSIGVIDDDESTQPTTAQTNQNNNLPKNFPQQQKQFKISNEKKPFQNIFINQFKQKVLPQQHSVQDMELNPALRQIPDEHQEQTQLPQSKNVRARIMLRQKKLNEENDQQRPKTRVNQFESIQGQANIMQQTHPNILDNKSDVLFLNKGKLGFKAAQITKNQLKQEINKKVNENLMDNEFLESQGEQLMRKKIPGRGVKLQGLDHNPQKFHLSRLESNDQTQDKKVQPALPKLGKENINTKNMMNGMTGSKIQVNYEDQQKRLSKIEMHKNQNQKSDYSQPKEEQDIFGNKL